jgi:hypothetical protein
MPLEFDASLPRYGIELGLTKFLYETALSLIPETPEEDDLKKVRHYTPVVWFEGLFPTMGVQVKRSVGSNARRDKPNLPGLIECEFIVYDPALVNYINADIPGLQEHEQPSDESGEALRRCLNVRNLYLDALYDDPDFRRIIDIDSLESRGGSRDELGIAYLANQERDVLWLDHTRFTVKL